MQKENPQEKLWQAACTGPGGLNREALEFLGAWSEFCHAIDDLVDEPARTAQDLIGAFAQSALVYSHPFYLRNLPALRQLALNIANTYADSVAWEKSGEPWQAAWADHHRHCGAEMLLGVAAICGGYGAMRAISLELRARAYLDHHDAAGRPV